MPVKSWAPVIPALVSWVQANQRLPSRSSTEPWELVLLSRLQRLRARFLQRSKFNILTQEELNLLEAVPLIYGYVTMPFKSWASAIPALVSWGQANQRLPSHSSTEPTEHVQYRRLTHSRSRFLQRSKLKVFTQEELQLLEAVPLIYGYVTKPFKSWASAIPDMVSWVQANQRLPSRSSKEPTEHVQLSRLQHLRLKFLQRSKFNILTQEELQLLEALLEAVPLIYGYVTKPPRPPPLPAIPALVSWGQAN
ncbi:unnamed protein product [Polarella glacialis]|uniref:Uncharacterized protein n=1 Tax=Polarella glacialis TaxID=89957 RepID=A0A813D943_POLGL|nr:unnamed protein product [Polarella glacialis]CAE8620491.1 unnamed protein product [Polarella glacialis]